MSEYDDNDDQGRPSKSQRKREVNALQALGEKLAELPAKDREQLELPARLEEAFREYQRIPSKHGARRRHLQFVGKLMRELSDEQIQRIDARLNPNVELEKKRFAQIERLRDRLLAGEEGVLDDVLAACPDIDLQQCRNLVRQAQKDATENRPPAASRKLFRLLRESRGAG